MRSFLLSVKAILIVSAVLAAARASTDRPNILFCISDDQSWPHAGAAGDAVVKTPAFDRVARSGVLFTHAFVDAPSSPPPEAPYLPDSTCGVWRRQAISTALSERSSRSIRKFWKERAMWWVTAERDGRPVEWSRAAEPAIQLARGFAISRRSSARYRVGTHSATGWEAITRTGPIHLDRG